MIKSFYIKGLNKDNFDLEHDKVKDHLKKNFHDLTFAFYTENPEKDKSELCILLDRDTDEDVVSDVKESLAELYSDDDQFIANTFPVPNLNDIYSHLIFLAERVSENNSTETNLGLKPPSLNENIESEENEEKDDETDNGEENEENENNDNAEEEEEEQTEEEEQVEEEVEQEEEEVKETPKKSKSKSKSKTTTTTSAKKYGLRSRIRLSEKARDRTNNNNNNNNNSKKRKSVPSVQKPRKRVRETDSYEVEKILGKRTIRNVTEYLVQWRGYPGQDTWERYSNFDTKEIVDEYDRTHPNA